MILYPTKTKSRQLVHRPFFLVGVSCSGSFLHSSIMCSSSALTTTTIVNKTPQSIKTTSITSRPPTTTNKSHTFSLTVYVLSLVVNDCCADGLVNDWLLLRWVYIIHTYTYRKFLKIYKTWWKLYRERIPETSE